MEDKLTILRLAAENFMRLTVVEMELDPDGGLVMITGKNGAGKTCAMNIVSSTLGGKKLCPEKPIREGATSGFSEVETNDWTATRTYKPDGSSKLQVVKADGCIVPKGQTFLEMVVGKIAFDPLAFINENDAKKQRKILLDLVGVDLTELDGKIAALREQRTLVGRTLKQAQAEVKASESYPDAPDAEISAGELAAELQKAVEHNNLILAAQRNRGEYEKEIEKLRADLAAAEHLLETANEYLEENKPIDSSIIDEKVSAANETNRQVKANVEAKEKAEHANQVEAKYAELTEQIEHAEFGKADSLHNADMPVEGLSVTEDGVTFNGIPIAQIATSEQIKVGMAVSMALNPTLKVLLIRDGSLLDSDNIKLIESMVKGQGFQCLIECVSDGKKKIGFVIENGMLKE